MEEANVQRIILEAAFKISCEDLVMYELKKTDPVMCSINTDTFSCFIRLARAIIQYEQAMFIPSAPAVMLNDIIDRIYKRLKEVEHYDVQFIAKSIEMLLDASLQNLCDDFEILCSGCEKFKLCIDKKDDTCNNFNWFSFKINEISILNNLLSKKYNFAPIKIRNALLGAVIYGTKHFTEIHNIRYLKQQIACIG